MNSFAVKPDCYRNQMLFRNFNLCGPALILRNFNPLKTLFKKLLLPGVATLWKYDFLNIAIHDFQHKK
jgi:hypothetical protein